MFYFWRERRGERTKKNEREREGVRERKKEKASVVRRAGILFVPTSKGTRRHPAPFSQGSFEISCINKKTMTSLCEYRFPYRSWALAQDVKGSGSGDNEL